MLLAILNTFSTLFFHMQLRTELLGGLKETSVWVDTSRIPKNCSLTSHKEQKQSKISHFLQTTTLSQSCTYTIARDLLKKDIMNNLWCMWTMTIQVP